MNKDSKLTLITGNKIPVIGLGTWGMFHTPETICNALALGYQLIDTSGNYGTQPGIGQGLKESGFERSAYFLTSKVEGNEDAYEATVKDLAEMQISYANLMLIHWPPQIGVALDKWEDLLRAREDGLTKDVGVSNYSIDQIQELIDATGEVPAVNQIEWTPFGHSREMLGYCQENGIIIQAYSPLTRGKRLADPTLRRLAQHYHKTSGQILIRWNLQMGVIPIIKATQPEHLKENIDVFDFELSSPDMSKLNNLNEDYSSLGFRSLPYISR